MEYVHLMEQIKVGLVKEHLLIEMFKKPHKILILYMEDRESAIKKYEELKNQLGLPELAELE
jgi:hypothetical protein